MYTAYQAIGTTMYRTLRSCDHAPYPDLAQLRERAVQEEDDTEAHHPSKLLCVLAPAREPSFRIRCVVNERVTAGRTDDWRRYDRERHSSGAEPQYAKHR